jgi:zinc transporter 1/2/3
MTDDDEVAIMAAEDIESGDEDPQEEHCHFHAGVE